VTASALFRRLADDGFVVSHVDIDQLGMLYPEQSQDQRRFGLKDEALSALLANYADVGVDVVVVSGVVDVDMAGQRQAADVMFFLLDPDEAALRERALERGWEEDDVAEVLAEASRMESAQFARAVLDTSHASVTEVVARIRAFIPVAPGTRVRRAGMPPQIGRRHAGIVVIYGPTAVGTSTIGWSLASSAWSRGIRAGFAVLDQLSFVAVPGRSGHSDFGLGIANLSALSNVFASRGADRIVVSAHLADTAQIAALRATMPGEELTLVRLHADGVTLAAHIRSRAEEPSARMAGDALLGADDEEQRVILDAALHHQRLLDRHEDEDLRIEVSGRTVEAVVDEAVGRLRW
jgi:broad-specificity NMP kinase